MKSKKIRLLTIFLLLLPLCVVLLGVGCDEDENSTTDLPIFKELPILYMGYNIENEETLIIRNQETLEIIFSEDLIAQIAFLQNIDFTRYDVLVGENIYTRGIAKLEHKFAQKEDNSYLYRLDVIYNDALPAGRFCYGIIVDKLPEEAVVKFEVTKINE